MFWFCLCFKVSHLFHSSLVVSLCVGVYLPCSSFSSRLRLWSSCCLSWLPWAECMLLGWSSSSRAPLSSSSCLRCSTPKPRDTRICSRSSHNSRAWDWTRDSILPRERGWHLIKNHNIKYTIVEDGDESYLEGEPAWLLLFRVLSLSSSVLSWAIWAFIIFVSSSFSPAVGSEFTLRSSDDKDFLRSCLWRFWMTLCCPSICDLSCSMCRVGSAWGSEDREELRPGELGYEGLDAVVSGENRSWLPVRTGDRVGTNRKTPSTSDSDIKHTEDKKNTKEIKRWI